VEKREAHESITMNPSQFKERDPRGQLKRWASDFTEQRAESCSQHRPKNMKGKHWGEIGKEYMGGDHGGKIQLTA